jgi:hypothetical protein
MQDTDAVSCILCLQADEYGSMIKVCVPGGRIPPSPERVICLRCVAAIAAQVREHVVGEIVDVPNEQSLGVRAEHPGADPDGSDRDGWDSDLPERTVESVVEADRSDAEIATDSSKERSAGSVSGAKTDD